MLRLLSNATLQALQEDFANCQFVIIDEISLLGCILLRKVDLRLREAKGVENVPFGGMFLFLLGDLKQLPQVKDRAFYSDGFSTEYADPGQQLFRQIEASVILPTSHRQLANQQRFRDLLDRLAEGGITMGDWQILMQRRLDRISSAAVFENSLRLFSTNNEVHDYNYNKLQSLQTPVYRIKSINNCAAEANASGAVADNLEAILHLSVGARVMLRRNLWTSRGLVNEQWEKLQTLLLILPEKSFQFV